MGFGWHCVFAEEEEDDDDDVWVQTEVERTEFDRTVDDREEIYIPHDKHARLFNKACLRFRCSYGR